MPWKRQDGKNELQYQRCKIILMIIVSKGLSPPVLAQGWMNDLGARPDMSIKVGFLSHDMRIAGRIVRVQSTKQSV